MATDATGTPTSPDGIPKYNTALDAPSGKGLNAIVDFIQTLLNGVAKKPSGIVSGEVPVWNGTTWVRSSATNVGATSLGSGTPDATKFLRGDGSWQIPVAGQKFTTSTLAGGPPGSPADGDIWIATAVNGTKKRWQFQYDSGEATAYKWKYIGGASVGYYDLSGSNRQNSVINTWQQVTGSSSIAIARAGYYRVRYGANMGSTNSSNINLGPAITNVAVGFSSIYDTSPVTAIDYQYSMMDFDMLDAGATALAASSSLFLNMATAVAVANSAISNPFFNIEPICVS